MDPDRQSVPLVRVPREEQYFDREEVLGRDAASVFPTESKKAAAAGAGLAELLGANKKFISETELQEIKSTMGLRPEDGTIAADKPLAEVLREAKEAKEAAFQEQWKKMKQGKNRPLDDDELDFVDAIAQQEAEARRRQREEEEAELAAFHAAQQAQQEGGGSAGAAAAEPEQQLGPAAGPRAGPQQEGGAAARPAKPAAAPKKQALVAVKPLVRPIVRVKSSGEQAAAAGSGGLSGSQPAAKRQRTEEQADSGSEGEGLAGLLGGYGSGSDSD
ncbi:NEFA-interacting nuclear NIP30,N-terminal [Chlorella sorokiniana]|uniref:NEFA-interacting nuclear NIP30,N-terminal n=1 Tax=Chlorella sorokiniana TaxID=3076 RepID=A0A2P6TN58_CHLSO|nr:NEFA-interacting nuclear NIP30,N-terminal [Chlorella sorokiniana]|eukprot:PRW50753.1 NEFA-interacting nuclear NIP30,N-terminal [Chlorella sorokiniana]